MAGNLPQRKMLLPADVQPGPLFAALKFPSLLSVMDDSVRDYIIQHFREAEDELQTQQSVTRQLEAELQADIHRDHKNGTQDSLLYQKLPPEIRAHIFSYVVAEEKSVHVFPPKGNESHGYRLSLCDESNYNFELGHCRCDDRRATGINQPEFFDNAVFLVSRSVRREALDAFFLSNRFTFTCLYELVRFTSSFKTSSSKIQNIRILERVDDYPNSDFRIKGIQKARQRLRALKHLEILVFLSNWSAYETFHEDGLVNQLLHFALGPPPTPAKHIPYRRRFKRKLSDAFDDLSEDDEVIKIPKADEGVDNDAEKQNISPDTIAAETTTSSSTNQVVSADTNSTQETSTEVIECLHGLAAPKVNPLVSRATSDVTMTDVSNCTAEDTPPIPSLTASTPPAFEIPPLKSFKANVRMRNLSIPVRGRPEASKAEYYANLYARLGDHLIDVFLDNGKKYRTIEDIPSLGPRPKLKVRDEERALTGAEKRGILFLKD